MLTFLITAAAVLLAAAPARGAVTDVCPARPLSQPFAPFLDPAFYSLAENGALEDGDRGWTLAGARVVAGNEPFHLNGPDDERSLALPAGSAAVSPPNCVSIEHPTVRFVARSTGSPLGVLAVTAVIRDGSGLLGTLPVGVVTGLGSSWAPSLPMVLANGLAAGLLEGPVDVRFRFEAVGLGAAFQVDDVFIDPYKRG